MTSFFHIDLKEKIMKRDSLQRRLIPEAGYSFNFLVHLIRKTMMSLMHHCMREEMGCNKFRDDFKQLKWELNHPAALDCTELSGGTWLKKNVKGGTVRDG